MYGEPTRIPIAVPLRMWRESQWGVLVADLVTRTRGDREQTASRYRDDSRKLRGGFYTPPELARILVDWAIRSPSTTVLDPACGDGVFLRLAAQRLLGIGTSPESVARQLSGVEIVSSIASETASRLKELLQGHTPNISAADFLMAASKSMRYRQFDAVIGNPPFIRYQNFVGRSRDVALKLMRHWGLKATKLTNAWVPFLLGAASLTRPGGRLAMVLPAELLQVNYASGIRDLLTKRFGFCTVVLFQELVFPEVQEEVVLLLVERDGRRGLRMMEASSISDVDVETLSVPSGEIGVPIEADGEKWTQFLLSDKQREALREAMKREGIRPLSKIARVDVGIVTGANDYFLLTEEEARTFGVSDTAHRMVSRTLDLPGVRFVERDWIDNRDRGRPVYLFMPRGAELRRVSVREYLDLGKQKEIHLRYKCRSRDPWFVTPSVYAPDAFLFRQSGDYPRLVLNEAKAVSTDTIHRVRFRSGVVRRDIVATFPNSLTAAFAEILGRSYGGGVLELQPNEGDELPVPDIKADNGLLKEVDSLSRLRENEAVLDLVDEVVLRGELSFKPAEVALFHGAWKRLAQRRRSRRPAAAAQDPAAGIR